MSICQSEQQLPSQILRVGNTAKAFKDRYVNVSFITETSPHKSGPRFAPNISYSKNGITLGSESKLIKSDGFQYFSVKSYVVEVY